MARVFLFDVGVIAGVKEEWNFSVWGRKSKIYSAFKCKENPWNQQQVT